MSQPHHDVFIPVYPFMTAAGSRIERIELKRLTVKRPGSRCEKRIKTRQTGMSH